MIDHFYRYFRWLSLDIVLGAIFFLRYLAHFYQVALSVHVYFALGSAIWLIYTIDHLVDGKTVQTETMDRHSFHRHHTKSLILLGGFILILALANVFFLDEQLIKAGALLSIGCVMYLLLVFFIRSLWIKEFLVAVTYAGGIFLAPLVYAETTWLDGVYVLELAGVALLNLLIFSVFDTHKDLLDGVNSLALRMGRVMTNWVIGLLGMTLMVLSAVLFILLREPLQGLYLLMTLILMIIQIFPGFFSQNERFRIVGDGVFYLAALFVFI